mgnify:CR=1 FL=1
MSLERSQRLRISKQRICKRNNIDLISYSYLNYELNKPSYWKFDYDEDDIADKPDEVLADLNRE